MRVTIVGSGDAFNGAGRSHSAYLVESTGCLPMMVDFGATSLAALRRIGREPNEVGVFAFTHLHGDHIGGFPFLFIDAMYNRIRRDPMKIVGPIGTQARLFDLLRVGYGGVADEPTPFAMEFFEVLPGEELPIAGYRIRAFEAAHMEPPERPLCLRIIDPEQAEVAFSGDTELAEGLRRAAQGVDLLIAECTQLEPPSGRHTTWREWKNGGLATIGARRIVLSHLGSDVREAIPQLLREAPEEIDLAFADDGQVLIVERS